MSALILSSVIKKECFFWRGLLLFFGLWLFISKFAENGKAVLGVERAVAYRGVPNKNKSDLKYF